MPREVTSLVYKFEELEPKAKEKARQWWRDCEAQDFMRGYPNFVHDEFETIAKILGVEFDQQRIIPMGGEKHARMEPKIWWGLHVQGSGASFDGCYSYAKGCVKKMKAYAPEDKVLHAIATDLYDAQRINGYRLTARVRSGRRGCASYNADIEVERSDGLQGLIREDVDRALRAFMDWMYKYIDAEWDNTMSGENVDESIRINEYEFEEDGSRACV